MSVDYHAIPSLDEEMARAFIEGDLDALTVAIPSQRIATKLRFAVPKLEPFAKDFAALAARTGMTEAEARRRFSYIELDWRAEEDDGAESYIQIIVQKYGVSLSHGSGGDRLMATLLRIIEALRAEHLHIWDPQRGDWLPAD